MFVKIKYMFYFCVEQVKKRRLKLKSREDKTGDGDMENILEKFADYVFDEKRADKVCVWALAIIAGILFARLLVTLIWGV